MASSILDNKITLTNLDFGLFTSILLKDIGFNSIKYILKDLIVFIL